MTTTAPKGYARRSLDIEAFWVPEKGPIHGEFLGAKLFDSGIDASKPSTLFIVRLTDPCFCTDKDDEIFTKNPGDIVGVWGKPGMKGLKNLFGVPVWMALTGEKDIGKGNPMKVFDIQSPKPGTAMPILEDMRERSKGAKTFLDSVKVESDNIPF